MKTQETIHNSKQDSFRIITSLTLIALLGMASVSPGAGDTWTQKAPLPTARSLLSASVVNGKIYAIGGDACAVAPSLSTVEEYDPVTDTWTEKAPMLIPRFCLSTSVVGGKIYAIGGTIRPPERVTSDVEEYDPETDTWTKKSPIPTARQMLATTVVNGKIYANGDMSSPQLTNPSQYVLMLMSLWRRVVMTLDTNPPFW